jgi:hypothetical protein
VGPLDACTTRRLSRGGFNHTSQASFQDGRRLVSQFQHYQHLYSVFLYFEFGL